MLHCYSIIITLPLVAPLLAVRQTEGLADGGLDLIILQLFERRLVVLRPLLENMLLEQVDRYGGRSANWAPSKRRVDFTFIQLGYEEIRNESVNDCSGRDVMIHSLSSASPAAPPPRAWLILSPKP